MTFISTTIPTDFIVMFPLENIYANGL